MYRCLNSLDNRPNLEDDPKTIGFWRVGTNFFRIFAFSLSWNTRVIGEHLNNCYFDYRWYYLLEYYEYMHSAGAPSTDPGRRARFVRRA
jgi:hypothetical protein